jgi:formiminotetrahydrofolate cyclodeaminase
MSTFSTHAFAALSAFFEGESPAGAGSAAALTGALGASVLATVARMRKATADTDRTAQLSAAEPALRALAAHLLTLAAEDRDAYRALLAAHRLPAQTDDEQHVRRGATEDAMKAATGVPLDIVRACGQAFHSAVAVATYGPARARGEVAVGVELLRAAAHGAGVCIAANLPAIADADFVAGVTREQGQLESALARDGDAIRLALAPRDRPRV